MFDMGWFHGWLEQNPNFASTLSFCVTHQKCPYSGTASSLVQQQVLLVPGQLCMLRANALHLTFLCSVRCSLAPQKAEAWRRCALFSLIPQSYWLTFVVGCDSTVSPVDIRSGQGVCFLFFFVETSSNTCVTKIWTPLPQRHTRTCRNAPIAMFDKNLDPSPAPEAHTHMQTHANCIIWQKSGPPIPSPYTHTDNNYKLSYFCFPFRSKF